jgi:hypothetical protein
VNQTSQTIAIASSILRQSTVGEHVDAQVERRAAQSEERTNALTRIWHHSACSRQRLTDDQRRTYTTPYGRQCDAVYTAAGIEIHRTLPHGAAAPACTRSTCRTTSRPSVLASVRVLQCLRGVELYHRQRPTALHRAPPAPQAARPAVTVGINLCVIGWSADATRRPAPNERFAQYWTPRMPRTGPHTCRTVGAWRRRRGSTALNTPFHRQASELGSERTRPQPRNAASLRHSITAA